MIEGLDTSLEQNPCYNCEKRNATCHGTCQDYLTWKKKNDAIAKAIRQKRASGKI